LSRSTFGPAAGTPKGAAPRITRTKAPPFVRLGDELDRLNNLHDPLAGWIYVLLCQHCVFDTGEFLGSYARLLYLVNPPKPEKGPWKRPYTYAMVRGAIERLVQAGLARRGEQNEAQGQLRLFIKPRVSGATPSPSKRRL